MDGMGTMNQKDKHLRIRNHVLDQLESGVWRGGDKLPGARKIAAETGISFLTVQAALDSLGREGILDFLPRKGTFVHPTWHRRILQHNLTAFDPDRYRPLLGGKSGILARHLPSLRLAEKFPQSIFEIRTTISILRERPEYMDLSALVGQACPDLAAFETRAFDAFRHDEALDGVPLIFSPRVMLYNPKLLWKAGCPRPTPGWTVDDLLNAVRPLRKKLGDGQAFGWCVGSYLWMNFILRAGGSLLEPGADDPVRIDSPETVRGLEWLELLRRESGATGGIMLGESGVLRQFVQGKLAFTVQPRECLWLLRNAGFDDWDAAPLPLIPGGRDVNVQATDVLCIRRSCTDLEQARHFLHAMLSEPVQDELARVGYGIPVRLSSAEKSRAAGDGRDDVFFAEIDRMTAAYHLYTPLMEQLVRNGIERIWSEGVPVRDAVAELAAVVRGLLRIDRTLVFPTAG